MNFLPCTYDARALTLRGDALEYAIPERFRSASALEDGQSLILGVRPEDIGVSTKPVPTGIPAKVYVSEPLGRENLLTLQLPDLMLKVLAEPEITVSLDQTVWLTFNQSQVHLFDEATEQSLRHRIL